MNNIQVVFKWQENLFTFIPSIIHIFLDKYLPVKLKIVDLTPTYDNNGSEYNSMSMCHVLFHQSTMYFALQLLEF